MSKAILVIDMPDKCCECPIVASWQKYSGSQREYWCPASEDREVSGFSKPSWCPLKELPKEKHWSEVPYYVDSCISYMQGWNNCLDKIRSK